MIKIVKKNKKQTFASSTCFKDKFSVSSVLFLAEPSWISKSRPIFLCLSK